MKWDSFKNKAAKIALTAGIIGQLVYAQTVNAAPTQGGTLTWIVTPTASIILPLTTSAGGSAEIGPKIVEGLLHYDSNLKPQPQLATSWEISPDGLKYTFHLRKGVKWHDGKDFTSADVAFSVQALKQVHPRGRSTFANVTSVKTPDAYTAVIELSKPAPYLITALAGTESPIIPKHIYEGTDIVSNPHNNAPIGTGPYIFKEFVKDNYIVLERNPNYWDAPKPYIDKIIVRFIPDAVARAAALETGSAQLGGQAIPLSDVKRFQSLKNVNVLVRDWPYVGNHQQLIFNFDTPILQNKAIRKAISEAIDVNALNRIVWYGYGKVSATPIGVANAQYHNNSIQHIPFNVKQSEADLDAAGYKRGANGTRFSLRLLYNPFVDRRAADFVRQSLAKVGIDAVIDSYDFGTYVTKAYTDRAFDLTLESLANVFDPTVGVQRIFWSKNFKIGLPFSNAGHYVNPEVDRLLEQAATEIDPAKRRQEFFQFQQIVHDDIANVELGANPSVVVAAKNLHTNLSESGEGLRDTFADWYFDPQQK